MRTHPRGGFPGWKLGAWLLVLGSAAAGPPPGETPSVRFATPAQSVLEGDGFVRVRVELSALSENDVLVPFSVSGTARAGRDYRIGPGPLSIPAGVAFADILVEIRSDDDEDERTESIRIALGRPSNAGLGDVIEHELSISTLRLGDPVEWISAEQREAFQRGSMVFSRRFTPSEGLGPFYNATSCASCHSTPVVGGGANLYRNFFLGVYQFGATPLSQSSAIPPFLSQVVPAFGSGQNHPDSTFTLEGGRPLIPETVFGFPVLTAQRNAIPVFGVGLFELVTDQTILSRFDPNDLDGDGISGRFNSQLNNSAVGRLGMKAQANNIELFTRGPLQNQMGITSDPLEGAGGIVSLAHAPMQVSANPNDPTVDQDDVPDPEISAQDLGDLIAFGKFLAPPIKRPFDTAALRGQATFDEIGCTGCHLPAIASSRGPLEAYTDLLIHFMGTELQDNIKLGDNSFSVSEFRTQPLWGIAQFGPFLHDGRAATLTEAIEAHGGEGQLSRDAFLALPENKRQNLIAFLEHL